jgi:hypothetical protein
MLIEPLANEADGEVGALGVVMGVKLETVLNAEFPTALSATILAE